MASYDLDGYCHCFDFYQPAGNHHGCRYYASSMEKALAFKIRCQSAQKEALKWMPMLSSDEKRQAAAERHPIKRIGSPQDIARLAVFLLSDAANWVTGQVLHVDGGMSSLRVFR